MSEKGQGSPLPAISPRVTGKRASPHTTEDGLRTGDGLPQLFSPNIGLWCRLAMTEDLHQSAFALWQTTGIPLLFP
jgi:hypothetical protein